MPPAILADVSCRRRYSLGQKGAPVASQPEADMLGVGYAASYRHHIQRYRRNLGLKGAPVGPQLEADMLGVGKLPLTNTRYSATGSHELLQTPCVPLS